VVSGVYGTTITFGGAAVGRNANVMIGWQTSDNSCGLRDLRWGGGQSVVPVQLGGTPGGGLVFYNYPGPGDLTVVITNDLLDPEARLMLTDIEFALSRSPLSLPEIGDLTGMGMVELRVGALVRSIQTLRDDVARRGCLYLPPPRVGDLLRTLDWTLCPLEGGLDAYLAGNPRRALSCWQYACWQMQSFIGQATYLRDRCWLPKSLYRRWVVDGGDPLAPAGDICRAIAALPEGEALQDLPPLPPGVPPPDDPSLDPAGYREWPVAELYPGEWTAFVVPHVEEGEAFLMRGLVQDGAITGAVATALVVEPTDDVVLEWAEQAVAESFKPDTEPPVITDASITPDYLTPPDHRMVEMTITATVTDNVGANWYIASVESNQAQQGLGDDDLYPDWLLDPTDPHALSLRAETYYGCPDYTGDLLYGRQYTITLMAIDMAGNLSDPYTLVVPVSYSID
jgi:hypothetical protein